jgi:hypothetical protein
VRKTIRNQTNDQMGGSAMNGTAKPLKINDLPDQPDHNQPEMHYSAASAIINERLQTLGKEQLIRVDESGQASDGAHPGTKQILHLEGLG